jgi:hypothetical protein
VPSDPKQIAETSEESVESVFTDTISSQGGDPAPETPAPDPATEPAPDPAPEQAPEQKSDPTAFDALSAMARDAGIDVEGIASSDDLARSLLQRVQSQQPYVSYAQQLLPYQDKIREMMGGEGEAEQPRKPAGFDRAAYFQEKYGGPAWKDEYTRAITSGQVTRDRETGLFKAAPGHELMVQPLLQELNAAAQHRELFWQGLSNGNFYEKVYDAIAEPIMQQVREMVGAEITGRDRMGRTADAIAQFEQQNAEWLYQHKDGVLVRNEKGEPATTEAGKALFDAIAEVRSDLREQGMESPSPAFLLKTAMKWVAAREPGTKPEAKPEAKPEPEQKKESFLESAMKRASHSASATSGVVPDEPEVMGQLDLDTMFTRAHQGTTV